MSDQLQASIEATPVEGSDLATDTGENQEEKITFSEEQQGVFDDAIGKKTFKMRQQQREFDDEKAGFQSRIQQLESQIPESTRPVVPEVPDSLDDNFESRMQAYQEAVKQTAIFDAQTEVEAQRQRDTAQIAQNEATKVIQDKVTGYSQRATALGIKPEELQEHGSILQQMGITGALADQLLGEDDGPLMSSYLAANPVIFDQLNNADQWSAGVILQNVRLKAAELKPQQSVAPAPADVLTGGTTPSQKRGPPGATYE